LGFKADACLRARWFEGCTQQFGESSPIDWEVEISPKPGSIFSEPILARRLLDMRFEVFYLLFPGSHMEFSNNRHLIDLPPLYLHHDFLPILQRLFEAHLGAARFADWFILSSPDPQSCVPTSRCDERHALTNCADSSPPASGSDPRPFDKLRASLQPAKLPFLPDTHIAVSCDIR